MSMLFKRQVKHMCCVDEIMLVLIVELVTPLLLHLPSKPTLCWIFKRNNIILTPTLTIWLGETILSFRVATLIMLWSVKTSNLKRRSSIWKKLSFNSPLNAPQFMIKTETSLKNQATSIWNLEVQVVQIANLLSGRPQGSLSSNAEINLKEQVKAITLRSEKQVEQPQEISEEVLAMKRSKHAWRSKARHQIMKHPIRPKNNPKSNLIFHRFLFLKDLEEIK